ncbi:MAG: nuclear transport factor 2 family protein [Methanoregulaceae archaeon]|nr:nuclear transport factor 2 family protein [Methanoregulaceae archaeon]
MEPSATASEDPGYIERILLAHEQARARAWTERNRQALEVLLAPEFVEINVMGRYGKKDIFVSLFPTLTLHDFAISEPRLISASPGTAILTYRASKDMTVKERRISGIFHVAAHYVKRENKWLLLLWQSTPWAGRGEEKNYP